MRLRAVSKAVGFTEYSPLKGRSKARIKKSNVATIKDTETIDIKLNPCPMGKRRFIIIIIKVVMIRTDQISMFKAEEAKERRS